MKKQITLTIFITDHPKLRAFITQSGRPSTLEAICNGVPLISFPIIVSISQ